MLKRIISLLSISLLLLIMSGRMAAADDDSGIPADVALWFKAEAQKVVDINISPDSPMQYPEDSVVGSPVLVFEFAEHFLTTKDPSAADLVISEQWIAPILSGKTAIGTIIAEREQGGGFAWMSDEDAVIGKVLTSLGKNDRFVYDLPAGTFVLNGQQATQYNAFGEPEGFTTTVLVLQGALEKQRLEIEQEAAKNNGEPSGRAGMLNLREYAATPSLNLDSGEGLPYWPVVPIGGAAVLIGVIAAIRILPRKN